MNSYSIARRLALGLAAISFAAAASAQTLSVQQATLTQGGYADIDYVDPSQAGKDIQLRISGNWPKTEEILVTLRLDSQGRAEYRWQVKVDWRSALFNAPGAQEVARIIL